MCHGLCACARACACACACAVAYMRCVFAVYAPGPWTPESPQPSTLLPQVPTSRVLLDPAPLDPAPLDPAAHRPISSQAASPSKAASPSSTGGGGAAALRALHVAIHSVDPFTAHTFRAIAHNAAGSSLPSAPSAPLLSQADETSFRSPPAVLSTSSASYLLSWPSQERCRPGFQWKVESLRM